MMTSKNDLLKLNMQFFAEGDGSEGNEGNDGASSGNDGNNTDDKLPKSMDELRRMMKREKESGRRAILKELGFEGSEDIKNTKEGLEKYREFIEKQKTDADRTQEKLDTATKDLANANKRADRAEKKLMMLSNGFPADSIDDMMVLIESKVNDDVTFEKAMNEIKEKYSSVLNINKDRGTGSGVGAGNSGKGGNKAGSYGEQLANKMKQKNASSDYYFKR